MKPPIAYAALAAIAISSAGAELAAQTHEAPAPASQVQEERAATPNPEGAPAGARSVAAEPEFQSLEEAIERTLRRQGIDVRIIDEKDGTESLPAHPQALPPSLAGGSCFQGSLFTAFTLAR